MAEMTCPMFDDSVGELVLDLLGAADRDALLQHAASCARCQAQVHSLTTVADMLPLLAPECEPPVGFESRVLAAITPAAQPSHRARRLLAVAAAVLVAAGGGLWAGHALTEDHPAATIATNGTASTRTLVRDDGGEHGWVMLAGGSRPTLTMHLSALDQGVYRCVLEAADGSTTEVAAWPVDASGAGDWTVPLTVGVDARRVIVLDEDGTTAASASFSV